MGSSNLDIIRALRATTKRLEKEKILKVGLQQNPDFFTWLYYALYYHYIYGVKKLPKITVFANETTPGMIQGLLEDLHNRKYTGHAATNRIIEIISSYCTKEDWEEFYSCVLIKDLKAGLSEKTVNKVSKKQIPVFECQLAKDSKDHVAKLRGKMYVQPKYDGVRALVVCRPSNSTVTILSRNGKVLDNFPHIESFFIGLIDKKIITTDVVFDGEIVSDSFHGLMTQVNRKTNVNTKGTSFCVFDIIDEDIFFDYGNTIENFPQHERHKRLVSIFDEACLKLGQYKHVLQQNTYSLFDDSDSVFSDSVEITSGFPAFIPDTKIIDFDVTDYEFVLAEMLGTYVEQGFEGIMIKNIDAPYKCARTDAWLKVKPSRTYDLTIVGVLEGKNKYEGSFGTFLCEGQDEEGRRIVTHVGSGVDDEMRKEIWKNQDSYIGKIIEAKCDILTKSEKSEAYSMRFPVFVRMRDDRND